MNFYVKIILQELLLLELEGMHELLSICLSMKCRYSTVLLDNEMWFFSFYLQAVFSQRTEGVAQPTVQWPATNDCLWSIYDHRH